MPPQALEKAISDRRLATYHDESAAFDIIDGHMPEGAIKGAGPHENEKVFVFTDTPDEEYRSMLGAVAIDNVEAGSGHIVMWANEQRWPSEGPRSDVTDGNPVFEGRHRLGKVLSFVLEQTNANEVVLHPQIDSNISRSDLIRLGFKPVSDSTDLEFQRTS